jgi:site-specific DNA recombinase
MKVIGYCRVSTDEQAREGVSMDAQREKIVAWAALNDHTLVEVFADEGISGKATSNRPGLRAAIARVIAEKGVLVVYSLSRLSRSTRDTINIADALGRAGAQLASCREKIDTTTAAGNMFFRLMAVLAEFERELIAERTQAALDHKWDKGEAPGNTPYGFLADAEGRLVPNEAEQVGLGIILRGVADGDGYATIARRLGVRGVPTRGGRPWERGVVRKIVRYYQGDRGQLLLAHHAPLYRDLALACTAHGVGAVQEACACP